MEGNIVSHYIDWITVKRRFILILFFVLLISQPAFASGAKNIVLMISDGAGYNMFHCASYYRHGRLGQEVYDTFPVKLGCTTYSLSVPDGYDVEKAWSKFDKIRNATDSPASGTALNTGVKTKKHRLGIDARGKTLVTFAQIVDSMGKSTGAISSVYFTHATPAAVWAHNKSRYNYLDIAKEMIYSTGLDVIMGPGHPEYNHNGKLVSGIFIDAKKIGGKKIFKALTGGTTGMGWTFIDAKEDFKALAAKEDPALNRVIGMPRVRETLQQKRKVDA